MNFSRATYEEVGGDAKKGTANTKAAAEACDGLVEQSL
jgi:hypothetical protein